MQTSPPNPASAAPTTATTPATTVATTAATEQTPTVPAAPVPLSPWFGEGQPSVHFQAIVASDSRQVMALEALFRWRAEHNIPWRGPDAMLGTMDVPCAHALLHWTLDEALTQAAHLERWTGWRGSLWINVEAHQVAHERFTATFDETLQSTHWPIERVVLQITSRYPGLDDAREHAAAIEKIQALRTRGLQLALHDFGQGHSSTARLQLLKPDFLRIPKSLVQRPTDPKALASQRAMFQGICSLARKQVCALIACGVENEALAKDLTQQDIPLQQGYLFGKPSGMSWWAKQLSESDRIPLAQYLGGVQEKQEEDDDWVASSDF